MNTNFGKNILSIVNCALCNNEDGHFCKDPIQLSCRHYICKSCLQPDVTTANCNICNQTNQVLTEESQIETFDIVLEQNLNTLYDMIYHSLRDSFNSCSELLSKNSERIDTHIEFMKDEVQIRIESIKQQLDSLSEVFCNDLDAVSVKWKEESKLIGSNTFDEERFKKVINNLEETIQAQQIKNKETLYHYENQLIEVRNVVDMLRNRAPTLTFITCENELNKSDIGELIYKPFGDFDKLIWFDKDVNSFGNSELQTLLRIRYPKLELEAYNEMSAFKSGIKNVNKRSILISSGSSFDEIYPFCKFHKNIQNIILFVARKQFHVDKLKNPKVYDVVTAFPHLTKRIDEIANGIKI